METNTQQNILVIFGENLVNFRKVHKISQFRMCTELEIEIKSYRKVERGQVNPQMRMIKAVINYFKQFDQNITVEELLKTL